MDKLQTKKQTISTETSPQLLKTILNELRLLRNEVLFLLPQDDLENYANSSRIKKSYEKAIKEFPPEDL